MDKLWNEIKRLADSNNGFIRTSDIETAGISRMVLRKYVDAGKTGANPQRSVYTFR